MLFFFYYFISFSFITFWGHSSFQAETAGLAPWCSAVNGLHRAARRQGSFLIGCRRASGAPRTATRSQGRRGGKTREETGERERERCSVWQLARSQRGPAETPRNGQQLPRSRVNAHTKKKGGEKKYAERTRGGSEGGRRCEDGSSLPARLRTVPAPRRGGTEVDRQEETREAWKKCSKLGRVVPQQVRPPSHSSCRR